jgi:hypothetical protein
MNTKAQVFLSTIAGAATTSRTSTTTSPAEENIFFVQNIKVVSAAPEAIAPHPFCSLEAEEQPVRYQ